MWSGLEPGPFHLRHPCLGYAQYIHTEAAIAQKNCSSAKQFVYCRLKKKNWANFRNAFLKFGVFRFSIALLLGICANFFFFCWNSRHLDISLYSGEVTPLSILACFRQKLITKKHQMSFSIFLTLYRNNGHSSYTIYTHLSSSPILSAKFPKSSTFSCRTYH